MPAVIAAILLALACTCSACGTSGRERDARTVVGQFQAALGQRDGTAACAELSSEASNKLEQDEGEPCRRAILGLGLPGGEPRGASVTVTSAAVSLTDGSKLFLDQGPAGWRISAAGCRPSAPDQPFDCELEG